MDIAHFVQVVVIPLLGLVLVVFNLYLNSKFKAMEENIREHSKRLGKVEDKQDTMKDNYIDRFDELKEILHKIDLKLVVVSGDIKEQTKYCLNVQHLKTQQ